MKEKVKGGVEKVGGGLRQGCGWRSSYGPDLPAAQTPARKRTYTKARSLNLCHHSSGKAWKWQEGRERKKKRERVWKEVTHKERHGAHVRNGVAWGDGHRMNQDEDKGWLMGATRQWCKIYLLGRILLRILSSTASGGRRSDSLTRQCTWFTTWRTIAQNSEKHKDTQMNKKNERKKNIQFYHCET